MEMNISYKDVEEQCNQLHELAKNMNDTIKQIADINSKLKSAWIGIASDAYTEQLEMATNVFTEIYAAIESSILYMASCAEGYQAIDEKVMEEICNYLNIDSNALKASSTSSGPYMPFEESSEGGGGAIPKTESKEETKISTGNNVTITDGEYKDMNGEITDIDEENNKATLKVNIDGQEKTVEVSLDQISANQSEV